MHKSYLYRLSVICLLFFGLTSNAATLTEDFEASAGTSYTHGSVTGTACVWTTSDAGVFTDATNSHGGNRSMRFGNTAASYAYMASDKSDGAATLSFYARTWSAADGAATISVQYSTDSGSTWTTAGTVTLSETTYSLYNYTINKTGNVRVKFLQTAGKRALIDDVTITDYTAAGITSPVNGSTVDFGTNEANVNKQMTVIVKGTGVTGSTTVAVSGTGFSSGSTTLSATKVNSETGAQLQLNFKGANGGSYTGTLTLTNGSSVIKVNLKATVSGTTTPTTGITSPVNGSTVDFGTNEANVNKQMTVIVKGTGVTESTTVAVSGTGFSSGSTTLSATKVNSEAGAQLQLNFKGANGGSYTGTLTLTNGTSVIKVNLKATVSGTTTPTTGITSPVNGSTVDFGTNEANTTKTMSVVVKGTGLTAATSVAASGTGFTVNTTSLSATKVNSETGATVQVNFKGANGGSYTGTLTLTNGTSVVKVGLTASVSGSTGGTTTARYITPEVGSTVDFGTVTLNKTQVSTVVVTGANLTAATTVTVTGTGFTAGATTLSATKVNSTTGAQLQINFKSATAGTFNGTLKLTSGTLTRTIALTAKASGSSTSSSGSSSGSGSTGSGSSDSGSSGSTSNGGATSDNIPDGYYSTCEGLYGSNLLSALCTKIYSHTSVSYAGLWTAFKDTDTKANGKIWDMYSTKEFTYSTNQCGSYTKIGDCYNREHSFPKSWFNDATPMYTDLHHIYPTDGFVNNQRANYPFGECSSGTYVSPSGTVRATGKLGKSTYSGYTGTVWEPDDEFKGDFARTYFYMVTAYNNKVTSWTSEMLDGTTYPAFTTWAINMLLNWNVLDPVSEKEINRNEAVYAKQKNRNPFIDHPELADYIWGSYKTTPWSSTTSVSAATISYPADGSTLSFGTVATGSTNEKIVSVKGTGLTGDITATVSGTGFSSAEVISTAAAEPTMKILTDTDDADELDDGIHVRLLFKADAPADYTGLLVLSSGDAVSNVNLTSRALDGLPAAPAENVTSNSFTARWVEVGDTFDDGTYRLDVADANGLLDGFPVYVDAESLTYEVTGLEPDTEYSYSLTSQTTQSNVIDVTTLVPDPSIFFVFDPEEMAIDTEVNVASAPITILFEGEYLTDDITFSVAAPFEVSANGIDWANSVTLPLTADCIWLRVGATAAGLYNSSLRAVSGDYFTDVVAVTASIISNIMIEDFEADKTGMGSYDDKLYVGTATQWNVHDAGMWLTAQDVPHAGTQCLRFGKEADSSIEMVPMKSNGMSRISFYARKWSATEAEATLVAEYCTEEGGEWFEAGSFNVTSTDYAQFMVEHLVTSPVKVRIRQTAGARVLIDDIEVASSTLDVEPAAVKSDFIVKANSEGVQITSAEEAVVSIYDVNGIIYVNSQKVSGTKQFDLPRNSVYIVVVNDDAHRVVIR